MKYIVVYNECLRSKLIYFDFINSNSKDIKLVVKLPILPSKKNKKTSFYLLKKGILGGTAISYIAYTFMQTIVYMFISKIFKADIESLCLKKKIKFSKNKKFPDKSFFKKKIYNFNHKEIIFCSTTHILKKKDLLIKNPVLNLHEADPRKHKGSAIYFRLAAEKSKYLQTTVMEPDEGIDTGRIIAKSPKKKIVNYSVFKIVLLGYLMQSKLIKKIKKFKIKKRFPKIKKITFGKVFSFPSYEIEKKMKKNKIKIFELTDYLFIIKLSYIKNCNHLYNNILNRIKKD
jgi:hypothetical protein